MSPRPVRNALRDRNPVVFLLWSYCFTVRGIIKAYRTQRTRKA